MPFDLSKASVVQWWDDVRKHSCGYCSGQNCSASNGMWAESLTVEDYQDLIDRGWRRSGKYCYKPIMQETCCPQYTIRCDAMNVSLSKSQKKVIKRFNRFLEDGIINRKDIPPEAQFADGQHKEPVFDMGNRTEIALEKVRVGGTTKMDEGDSNSLELGTGEPCDMVVSSERMQSGAGSVISQQGPSNKKLEVREGTGADPAKPPSKKAKLMRIERKKEKLMKMGLSLKEREPKQTQKSVEEFLNEISENSKHKLKLHLVPTSEPNLEWRSVEDIEFNLYSKYQKTVHNDPPEKLSLKGFQRFLVHSPLKITMERMSVDNKYFHVSAKLFKKYQTTIHNESEDECDEMLFKTFLVHTPLLPKKFPNSDGPGFGSFHQQYWLDDKLVAVGVIDILPRCVSSVYFFYDPDYRSLTLGTYGSMKELELTRSLQQKVSGLCNYYMGFYIHSCPKMRYKGKLSPSYIACPETYVWIPIEDCIPLLDVSKYSRLNPDIDGLDNDLPSKRDLANVKVVYEYQLMTFRTFSGINPNALQLFTKIGKLVGKRCANRIVFCIV